MSLKYVVVASLTLAAGSVSAQPIQYLLFATPQQVEDACGQMGEKGVKCLIARGNLIDRVQADPSLKTTDGCYGAEIQGYKPSLNDRFLKKKICGLLLLGKRNYDGIELYSGLPLIIKSTPAGNAGMPDVDSQFDEQGLVIEAFRRQLSAEPLGSPKADDFIAGRQNQIREEKANAQALAEKQAKEALDAKAKANSPERRRADAAEKIAYCDQQIEWAKGVINHEDRVAKITGVKDLAAIHRAGDLIVGCQDLQARERAVLRAAKTTQ